MKHNVIIIRYSGALVALRLGADHELFLSLSLALS